MFLCALSGEEKKLAATALCGFRSLRSKVYLKPAARRQTPAAQFVHNLARATGPFCSILTIQHSLIESTPPNARLIAGPIAGSPTRRIRRILMLRNSALLLAAVPVCAIAVFMIACGSSSSPSGTQQCTGTYTVVGDWQGTLTSSGSPADDLFGVINTAGGTVLFDNEADILTLDAITGACSFSAAVGAYASIENGGLTGTGTATGNVTSDTSFNGTVSVNGASSALSFTSYNPLGTGSVTADPGIDVFGYVEGQALDSLLLSLGGTSSSITFTGTDASDCTVNGTFTEETAYNVYDVTYDVTGTGCVAQAVPAGNYTGVGFESDSDILAVTEGATGTYLYAVITSSSAPFVLEIPPGCEECGDARTRTPRIHPSSHSSAKGAAFRKAFGWSRRP